MSFVRNKLVWKVKSVVSEVKLAQTKRSERYNPIAHSRCVTDTSGCSESRKIHLELRFYYVFVVKEPNFWTKLVGDIIWAINEKQLEHDLKENERKRQEFYCGKFCFDSKQFYKVFPFPDTMFWIFVKLYTKGIHSTVRNYIYVF